LRVFLQSRYRLARKSQEKKGLLPICASILVARKFDNKKDCQLNDSLFVV
jgi:hypothetical protein